MHYLYLFLYIEQSLLESYVIRDTFISTSVHDAVKSGCPQASKHVHLQLKKDFSEQAKQIQKSPFNHKNLFGYQLLHGSCPE